MRKFYVEHSEPELSHMLLEAAEKGRLSEIADALSQITSLPSQLYDRRHLKFVQAYVKSTDATGHQMPKIAEFKLYLRKALSPFALPKDRTIRDILKRLGLPIESSPRGRPRKR
jgi:hypothetical protein